MPLPLDQVTLTAEDKPLKPLPQTVDDRLNNRYVNHENYHLEALFHALFIIIDTVPRQGSRPVLTYDERVREDTEILTALPVLLVRTGEFHDLRMGPIDFAAIETVSEMVDGNKDAELIALRKARESGLRGTIQKAWLKKRKAKTVGKLKLALDEYEKTLDSKILVDVRQILEALDAKQQGQSKQLEQDLSRISSDLKACQSGFPAHLRLEIDKSFGKSLLILGFYFWLSGSEMQRSFKGFLCSIIHQLAHEDRLLATKLLHGDTGLLKKQNPGDWSTQELQRLLMHVIGLLDRSLCIFLDGLDEFDQEDDVDRLLNLVEGSSISGMTRICISSRPENYIATRMRRYKKLLLQDLIAHDIAVFIRAKLDSSRTQCLPAAIDDDYLERIISIVAEKADDVFLWVHYALSSLIRGMRNEDNFAVSLRPDRRVAQQNASAISSNVVSDESRQ
ncbi:MAG: hypothetical protein Q9197_006075 [Variospora fuerteventurae]